MNFEKVEIYGFKSFADKAEIKFGNGITGIVGPNGCGKSNVADAIRWVLGEQSAKSLRGSSMQDVIFNGTQNRRSLSYCEVSLFFDNTNKMFSLDYNEVIITRKLYRSGESEYFINKQPARLKDIIELLHECGIGKEGYTIIGQGKVEEIVSAKPEDRRLIFEEATGIAKFKTRKKESERSLERTHENVVRLNDILSEIENQLTPLEKQAEKAKEYNQLSEELKFHEINTYIAKFEGVETEKGKIYTRIKGIDENTALRQSELVNAQNEYEKIFTDINSADENLRKLNEELLEKRVGMEKSSGAKKLFEEKISYLLGQIERAESEIEKNVSLINECSKSIDLGNEEYQKTQKELKDLSKKADEIGSKLLIVTEKILLGEELASENQRKIIQSIENLSDIKLNKGTMSIEKQNLMSKLDELSVKLDELSVKRDSEFNEKEKIDKKIDELDRSIFEHKNKISELEDEVRSGNENAAVIDNKIYSLNTIIASLVTKDNFYKELKDKYEGYQYSVKLLLNSAKNNPDVKRKIKGVVAELIKSDKKFDVALETALGGAAQNVVTANPDDAKYLINYLKANKFGVVTFLPVTSVRPRINSADIKSALREKGALGIASELVSYDAEYENIISNLLGNTLIVDNIENATEIAKKYRFAFKMVTLDGEVFSTQGAMSGGFRKKDGVGILSGDRKLEENAKQLAERRQEMEELKVQKAEIENKRDKALDSYNISNDAYNGIRQQLMVEREKQAVSEKNLIEIGKEIESVNELIDTVKDKINKLSVDFEQVMSGSKKFEEDKENASLSANKHQAEFDELKKQRDTLSEQSTDLQVKITQTRAKIETLTAENKRITELKAETEKANESLRKSNDGARSIIEELKVEEEKVSLSQAEQDLINSIRAKIENVENFKSELREKLNANDLLKEKINEELNLLSEKKHHEEISLAKIDENLEYLKKTILEDYNETYETAVKFREEGYDGNKGEAEINRIKRKRSALGAINATAIEDFKMMKERFEEMAMQRDDLLKAEEDIKTAIDKIKAQMLEQFDEGFAKINENFQKIFKELFGGGKAMLQIDYSEVSDRLEAGVEIVAEPPGKKLQKLSLLSGGEKALTAIAILFAIIRMRPMPFCILDEIEAALDEANVDRFATYLKKFSEETQFIVITHRKPTMELADALFGVTMQEKGVSKLVSVKLSDVSELTGEALA